MLFPRFVFRVIFSTLFILPTVFVSSAAGQGSAMCTPTTHAIVLFAPEANLERKELEILKRAKVSVDLAMYSFTDHELADELVRLARSGVRVRVYRDSREYREEIQSRSSTTATLLAGGVAVRVKGSHDLMHFKSYVIDGCLLRTGSANWSPTGLERQDNDVHYEVDTGVASQFETRFEAMWNRSTNFSPLIPAR